MVWFLVGAMAQDDPPTDPEEPESTADIPAQPFGVDDKKAPLCVLPRGELMPDCSDNVKDGNGWGANPAISAKTIIGLPDLTKMQGLCNTTADAGFGTWYHKQSNNWIVYGHANGCCWATLGTLQHMGILTDGSIGIGYQPCYTAYPGPGN